MELAKLGSAEGTYTELERQRALRMVVQRCIYGVDKNPLAVELCRVALWIEALDPGRPLSFLDSHVRLGDSLLGVLDPHIMKDGIPQEAYTPLTGDDRTVCSALKRKNRKSKPGQLDLFWGDDRAKEVARTSRVLDDMPEDSLEDIRRKRVQWQAARKEQDRASLREHLFVTAFLSKKSGGGVDRLPPTRT